MIIHVKTKPNAKKESLQKISEKEYSAEIKEIPEKNKANIRLINILAKEFKVSPKQIKIKNPRSRDKIIEIDQHKD